ncbi:MAG: hypothetical protein EBU90_21655 [Proteobacteria bacterium]|nr:hypothetical protein [Pseudomonadota bacterium]
MHQLEIQFFWPLTEQIPLELDYGDCDTRPKITTNSLLYSSGFTLAATQGELRPVLKLTEDAVTFTYKEDPPWYRKLLLKIIGFNWEKR